MRLRMGFVSLSWSSQLPFAIADELGYLRDEGVEIEPQLVRSGGPVLVAMLLSGEIDGMISGIEARAYQHRRRRPARIVGGMSDRSDYSLVGAHGLRSVDELRGQTVAVTGAGTYSEFATTEALRRLGWSVTATTRCARLGNTSLRLAALSTGQVQAVPLDPGDCFHAEGDGLPVLVELRDVIPEFPFSYPDRSPGDHDHASGRIVGLVRAIGRAQDVIRETSTGPSRWAPRTAWRRPDPATESDGLRGARPARQLEAREPSGADGRSRPHGQSRHGVRRPLPAPGPDPMNALCCASRAERRLGTLPVECR